MKMTEQDIAVGIPTFRRPKQLQRSLSSLLPSLRECGATLLVADNACDPATEQAVHIFRRDHFGATNYIGVPERGISANRNAIIEKCLALEPRPTWLGMLDDDIAVGPDWLSRMVEAGEEFGVTFVGAPCNADVGATPNLWVRNSIICNRHRRPEQYSARLSAAGNVLMRVEFLATMEAPYFCAQFDLSGGEDYDFFRRAQRRKASFGWTEKAEGIEMVDESRLSASAQLWRYYTSGNYNCVADMTYDGALVVYGKFLKIILRATVDILFSLLRTNPDGLARAILQLAYGFGGTATLLRLRYYRYR